MLLTVIIWGFILFIVGVGATYVHDHLKVRAVNQAKREADEESENAELLRKHREFIEQERNRRNRLRQTAPTPIAKQVGAKRVVKPGATKTVSHKLDEPEQISIQEMIERIEKMRNKSAGRATDGSIDDAITQDQLKKLLKGDDQ